LSSRSLCLLFERTRYPEYLDRTETTAITAHDVVGDCLSAKGTTCSPEAIVAWNAALDIGVRAFAEDDPRCAEGGEIEAKIEAEEARVEGERVDGIAAAAAVLIEARYRGRMDRRRFLMEVHLKQAGTYVETWGASSDVVIPIVYCAQTVFLYDPVLFLNEVY
jgi:hypothetical protein